MTADLHFNRSILTLIYLGNLYLLVSCVCHLKETTVLATYTLSEGGFSEALDISLPSFCCTKYKLYSRV